MARATESRLRVDKPALFRYLEYEPHPGQRPVHESNAPRRVLAAGVRWGKSLCAGMEALAAALEPAERSCGWVVAPSYELAQKVYREVTYAAMKYLRHRIVQIREHDHKLVLRNLGGGLSEVRAKSADSEISLLGEALDWVVIDEAARLKPRIWEAYISQRLIDRKGWALMISTPRGKGWFYGAFQLGQGEDPDFESWRLPSLTNPYLDADLIERERERLPKRVFDQEYMATFASGDGQVFMDVRERALLDTWSNPKPGEVYYAGLDLARVQDYSVLCVLNESCEVVFVDRFHRIGWTQQVARIRARLNHFNHASVLVDSTGAGDPVYEALRAAGCNARPYTFTSRSKAALIDHLTLLLERGEITLPTPQRCPELIEELEAFEYSVTDTGNVRTSAPAGTHDDCVVSLALAAYGLRTRRRVRLSRLPWRPALRRRPSRWTTIAEFW